MFLNLSTFKMCLQAFDYFGWLTVAPMLASHLLTCAVAVWMGGCCKPLLSPGSRSTCSLPKATQCWSNVGNETELDT